MVEAVVGVEVVFEVVEAVVTLEDTLAVDTSGVVC